MKDGVCRSHPCHDEAVTRMGHPSFEVGWILSHISSRWGHPIFFVGFNVRAEARTLHISVRWGLVQQGLKPISLFALCMARLKPCRCYKSFLFDLASYGR